MPLYIPWLTETIKKRGVRYLLHHYLGQFFEEKLTLEQLSIDIYEGKGSIRDLALDVNGLNEELDFIPFKFLEGCSIGQISVEVPWISLATEACKVELESARFICRLKTSADGNKAHCSESTLLSRSLMTSSMQMAEDIVTTETDDEYESTTSSVYRQHYGEESATIRKRDASQMFEGLEMFAQLIDSVLRRTKLTARDTLFQIQPHESNSNIETVEFFIKFFRCEEIMEQSRDEQNFNSRFKENREGNTKRSISAIPETVTKLLTLEDVEMRIGGIPVSNLIGKHTIMIKFNGKRSEISIFSGSPLLAVISHQQLKTFFNVFEGAKERDDKSSPFEEKSQKIMSSEDYAKIENQLLENASQKVVHRENELGYLSSSHISSHKGRCWINSNSLSSSNLKDHDCEFHSTQCSSSAACSDEKSTVNEPTLENLEAFSCELKLPGIWLCILRDGEALPPLIKPYADSINSFDTINKYIDQHIKVPHIRLLALKVSLDLTAKGINIFLGDLDVLEYLQDDSLYSCLHLLQNDLSDTLLDTPRYKASILNNKEITLNIMAKTRIIFDPTIIDRLVLDYKLLKMNQSADRISKNNTSKHSSSQLELKLTVLGEQFKVELLCPIPDLSPGAAEKTTKLRPQSFLFQIKKIEIKWQSDKLYLSANAFNAFVKTQPQQSDEEAIKFIEATSRNSERIVLTLEPTPSKLDTVFPSDVEQVINESSLYDSIYVAQAFESHLPKEAFQTKRKVLRETPSKTRSNLDNVKTNECDSEKIITPGDRQHLIDYLNQTVMCTKLSLKAHFPICEIEFEDKKQLDLIYNRFANDFVFWQPKASIENRTNKEEISNSQGMFKSFEAGKFNQFDKAKVDSTTSSSDEDSDVSFHSLGIDGPSSDYYINEMTCKITVDELFIKFNHQSCLANMKQEISTKNFLLGVIIDVNKRPGTILSLVSDDLELCNDSDIIFEGNTFGDKSSSFSLTAEIKRPMPTLKDIKLAIQLVNGLFTDFKTETYTRFWQSINVTDEPISGFVAPKIVVELHIDILNTALSLVRESARPSLITIDELYLNSMVMEQTSQIMLRLVADEVSLHLKKNCKGLEAIKNYICIVDCGLIDLDIKFSREGQLEFKVINNVINVRACQDSLSAICRLFEVIVKNKTSNKASESGPNISTKSSSDANCPSTVELKPNLENKGSKKDIIQSSNINNTKKDHFCRFNLLEDAMNDYCDTSISDTQTNLDSVEYESSGDDSDVPPVIQKAAKRDPNVCLLDESNSMIGNFLPQPLLPSNEERMDNSFNSSVSTNKSLNESGFFVIGDDDVGAGIIGKLQREPLVRKLINGPINIIENYIRMTKPRTLPEKLIHSLERYVLEEMTLVISLYGGRDLDEEKLEEDCFVLKATNEEFESKSLDAASTDSSSIRSRASSIASAKKLSLNRKHSSTDSSNNLIKKKGNRRKHLSEGSREVYRSNQIVEPARVRFGEGAVNLWESLDLMSSPDFVSSKRPSQPLSVDSKMAGGTWRQNDVCIQLTLSKMKLLYELGTDKSPISWRFMLFVHDIEVKDKIHASDINKMLYEYCTESMPKRNTQMLTIKNIATINPSDGCEECDLKVSIKPLRLNIDQDTLLFLIEFFTSLSKSLNKHQTAYGSVSKRTSEAKGGDISQDLSSSKQADATSLNTSTKKGPTGANTTATTATTTIRHQVQQPQQSFESSALPTHCHMDGTSASGSQHPIYIKSFTFSPDVPIRLDYHAKHLDFEQGALAGILMGLAHLDHSELVLRRVQALHGMRGLDRVLLFAINSWMSDIKRNQLPSILSGVGPMHSVIQLFQGVRDLIWMPIDHYRKDRRLVRGLQRGASSFSSSTAMAAINLVNRFISIVQCTAQIAHDIVTPPSQQSSSCHRHRSSSNLQGTDTFNSNFTSNVAPSSSSSSAFMHNVSGRRPCSALNQPRNFCEGVAVGYTIIKEGFNDTARNVAVGMQAEDVRTAMGELVRQIPSTLLNPIISATEGAQNVLVGIRNQIAPDARREDQEKWKRRVRGK